MDDTKDTTLTGKPDQATLDRLGQEGADRAAEIARRNPGLDATMRRNAEIDARPNRPGGLRPWPVDAAAPPFEFHAADRWHAMSYVAKVAAEVGISPAAQERIIGALDRLTHTGPVRVSVGDADTVIEPVTFVRV